MTQLTTDRLLLRPWRTSDYETYAAMNRDPEVMEHFPSLMEPEQSYAQAEQFNNTLLERGYGLWAVEVRTTGEFIGFTGLSVPSFEAAFQPAVEVGWRLARVAWGNGYATEAARAALAYGFGPAGLDSIVSFTAQTNLRSQRVMQRIGMMHDIFGDFDHPGLPEGHRLRRHVLYRITEGAWREQQRSLTTLTRRTSALVE